MSVCCDNDSSLFTCVKGVSQTHERLVKDLQTVSEWGHQWKMVFNPDLTKQAIEIVFYSFDVDLL